MEENKIKQQAEEVVEKVKELVKKGNVSRIVLKRNEETVLSLPLNVGIVGTVLGLKAAPWALLMTALVTFGLKCRLEIVKTDGKTVDLNGKTIGEAADSFSETVLEKLRNAGAKKGTRAQEVPFAEVVSEDAEDADGEDAQ